MTCRWLCGGWYVSGQERCFRHCAWTPLQRDRFLGLIPTVLLRLQFWNMGKNTFKPRQSSSREHSANLKTIQNRKTEMLKRGVEVALLRADTAFRTAKSRGLAKLRESPQWVTMNERERQDAENDIIKRLELRRDDKKRKVELEWRYKVEEGLVDEDEEMEEVYYASQDMENGTDDGSKDYDGRSLSGTVCTRTAIDKLCWIRFYGALRIKEVV
jgi:hypothetical protein